MEEKVEEKKEEQVIVPEAICAINNLRDIVKEEIDANKNSIYIDKTLENGMMSNTIFCTKKTLGAELIDKILDNVFTYQTPAKVLKIQIVNKGTLCVVDGLIGDVHYSVEEKDNIYKLILYGHAVQPDEIKKIFKDNATVKGVKANYVFETFFDEDRPTSFKFNEETGMVYIEIYGLVAPSNWYLNIISPKIENEMEFDTFHHHINSIMLNLDVRKQTDDPDAYNVILAFEGMSIAEKEDLDKCYEENIADSIAVSISEEDISYPEADTTKMTEEELAKYNERVDYVNHKRLLWYFIFKGSDDRSLVKQLFSLFIDSKIRENKDLKELVVSFNEFKSWIEDNLPAQVITSFNLLCSHMTESKVPEEKDVDELCKDIKENKDFYKFTEKYNEIYKKYIDSLQRLGVNANLAFKLLRNVILEKVHDEKISDDELKSVLKNYYEILSVTSKDQCEVFKHKYLMTKQFMIDNNIAYPSEYDSVDTCFRSVLFNKYSIAIYRLETEKIKNEQHEHECKCEHCECKEEAKKKHPDDCTCSECAIKRENYNK